MPAAGLSGIEEELELCDACEADIGEAAKPDRASGPAAQLPKTLFEAIERFEASELMKETLGPYAHSYLVKAKAEEWDAYQRIVTPWELDRLLAVL